MGHIELDTPTQRLGEITPVPIDAETVTLSFVIEGRFDIPDRNKNGQPVVRTEWKPIGQVAVVCTGVDPSNKHWKTPVFLVVGKKSVGGKSLIKLIQIDPGVAAP